MSIQSAHFGNQFHIMQKVGKAFMLPIAILPAAGLLLGIGGALSNPNTLLSYPALNNPIAQGIFKVMTEAGATIFTHLALLLTIGLCIGLAKRDKGTAALAGVTGYLVMQASIMAFIHVFSSDKQLNIDTGIIGSLLMGSLTVYLHNRFYNIQLPAILGFFGGSRFVPIITAGCAIFVGLFFFLIWPGFQQFLVVIGEKMASLGAFGTFLYGFLLRLSGAIGLHHTIYPMFWFTELGGVEQVAGANIAGAQKIFFAQLADPQHQGLFTEGTRFFAGRFATMMFGLPAAALAMYHAVPAPRRAKYAGLFLGAALTSFITGITEPIEFMFLFTAPLLYVIHAFLDGVSFFMADLLNIRIGNTFSGGLIDFFLFGILQGEAKTHWLYVLPVGALWFGLYYALFRAYIRLFNVATPGRISEEISDEETSNSETQAQSSDLATQARAIISALGGADNIEEVDACITRLRITVTQIKSVDSKKLKLLGASAVIKVAKGVQIVYGAKAVLYKETILQQLERLE